MTQWLRLPAPNAGSLGLIPGQGTRSYMLNQEFECHVWRSHVLQLRIPHASTKDPTCLGWDLAQPNKEMNKQLKTKNKQKQWDFVRSLKKEKKNRGKEFPKEINKET